MDNRPFLRCLNGFGYALWRLGRIKEAEPVFERMLWLSPSDNQGARFSWIETKQCEAWTAPGNSGRSRAPGLRSGVGDRGM